MTLLGNCVNSQSIKDSAGVTRYDFDLRIVYEEVPFAWMNVSTLGWWMYV